MFFNSTLFWFLMGIITVLVGAGFKAFANGYGWTLNWWKWLLSIIWYTIFSLLLYAYGTLVGENEGSAGIRILFAGFFICIVLGVGLWRLLASKPKASETTEV